MLLTVIYSIVLAMALGTAAISAYRAFNRRMVPVRIPHAVSTQASARGGKRNGAHHG